MSGIGVLDIGSKQCVLNAGVLDDEVFTQTDGTYMIDGAGRQYSCRFQELVIRLEQDGVAKDFLLPVYGMPIGRARPGTP